jgi:hypothetical protein
MCPKQNCQTIFQFDIWCKIKILFFSKTYNPCNTDQIYVTLITVWKNNFFWDLKLWTVVEVYKRFGGTYRLHLQDRGISLLICWLILQHNRNTLLSCKFQQHSTIPHGLIPQISVLLSISVSLLSVSQDFRVCLTNSSFPFVTEAVGQFLQAVLTCTRVQNIKVSGQPWCCNIRHLHCAVVMRSRHATSSRRGSSQPFRPAVYNTWILYPSRRACPQGLVHSLTLKTPSV